MKKKTPVKTVRKAKTEGPIYDSNTMFLRFAAGTAEKDGVTYELSHNVNGAPIIRNEKTGRWWAPTWRQLMAMALAAGLDEQDAMQGKHLL